MKTIMTITMIPENSIHCFEGKFQKAPKRKHIIPGEIQRRKPTLSASYPTRIISQNTPQLLIRQLLPDLPNILQRRTQQLLHRPVR